jgi:hypothetical protein
MDIQSAIPVLGMRYDCRFGGLVKVIWWDGQGACMFLKRLEKGRLV